VVLKIGWFWSSDLHSADQQFNMQSNTCSNFIWLKFCVLDVVLLSEARTAYGNYLFKELIK